MKCPSADPVKEYAHSDPGLSHLVKVVPDFTPFNRSFTRFYHITDLSGEPGHRVHMMRHVAIFLMDFFLVLESVK